MLLKLFGSPFWQFITSVKKLQIIFNEKGPSKQVNKILVLMKWKFNQINVPAYQ
jgi:hypothetical protein